MVKQKKTGREKSSYLFVLLQPGGKHNYILVSDMDFDEKHLTIKDILNENLQYAK